MNISEILSKYDELEATHDLGAIEDFLLRYIDEAKNEGDVSSLITLYNEGIGFYRETSRFEESISMCRDLLILMEEASLNGTVDYATSLLNIANACRAAGLLKESNVYYNEVLRIYNENMSPEDLRFAPLYNNMALLFQEMGDFESAVDTLSKALMIVKANPGNEIKVAISHTNLAMSYLKCDGYDEAIYNLNEAFKIFDSFDEPDYHYGAALSAMGEAKYQKGEYEEAADYYEKALYEVKKNTGYSKAYEITLQNLYEANKKANESEENESVHLKGLELARLFYEECGKKMIHDKFPEYEDKMAVGLAGEGSECLGYDDEISEDHDFGPGFCIWLTDDVYEKIGAELQKEYECLPLRFRGYVRRTMYQAKDRVGVFKISDWYRNFLGFGRCPMNEAEWLMTEDSSLNKATNGEVFFDGPGVFTKIRNELLEYFPENIYLRKLANEASLISQYGQYNYPRMTGRGESAAAAVSLGLFMEHSMKMIYLLNGRYAPFYKWLHRGVGKLAPQVAELLTQISLHLNDHEENVKLIDEIATYIFEELKKKGLVSGDSNYLDHHTGQIMSRVKSGMTHAELVEKIVRLEWEAFDKVKNEGGRASCQDDWATFSIMRKSQYLTWSEDMLLSYLNDFVSANERGWNLITEKYGRMEESTAPEEWEKIKDLFPPISDEKKAIIESIVAIQTGMMEEFAKEYPKAASQTRIIHTKDDTPFDTSYETYLRGEISTYSDETLALYGRFIAGIANADQNLAKLIIENSAFLYGYKSLEDMESKI